MSIDLVDPILISIAAGLKATPARASPPVARPSAASSAMKPIIGGVSSRVGGRAPEATP